MTTQIANEDLLLEKIPNPEGESSDYQETWAEFALIMNGYEVYGDFESFSNLASLLIKEPMNASFYSWVFCSCSNFAGSHQFVLSEVMKDSYKMSQVFQYSSHSSCSSVCDKEL